MSRIGKKPVAVPSGVTATLDGQTVSVKGPKGQLAFTVPEEIAVLAFICKRLPKAPDAMPELRWV